MVKKHEFSHLYFTGQQQQGRMIKKEIAAFSSPPTQSVTTHCGINALKFWAV